MCYFAVCLWKLFSLQSTLTPSQWLKNGPFAMNSCHKISYMSMKSVPNSSSKSLHKIKLTIYQRVCPPLASITACNLVGME